MSYLHTCVTDKPKSKKSSLPFSEKLYQNGPQMMRSKKKIALAGVQMTTFNTESRKHRFISPKEK